jgi:peptide/nickel transport system permease protein
MAVDTATAPLVRPTEPDVPPSREGFWRRLLRDRLAVAGLVIVTVFGLAALAAPWLAPHDPSLVAATDRLLGPSLEHPLGTDHLGRDTFSRLLYGARWSLGLAAVTTALVVAVGVFIGMVSGFVGGLFDAIVMRLIDVLLGFPNLILALAIVGVLGPDVWNLMLGLVLVWWVEYARIVRGLVLSVREQGHVQVAIATGAQRPYILRRHVLPAVMTPVVVLASLEMGSLMLAISGLSFLGLGVQPPTPEWGSMLNQGRAYLAASPQLMIYPGLAITLTVLGFNLIGDGIRDSIDPRLQR